MSILLASKNKRYLVLPALQSTSSNCITRTPPWLQKRAVLAYKVLALCAGNHSSPIQRVYMCRMALLGHGGSSRSRGSPHQKRARPTESLRPCAVVARCSSRIPWVQWEAVGTLTWTSGAPCRWGMPRRGPLPSRSEPSMHRVTHRADLAKGRCRCNGRTRWTCGCGQAPCLMLSTQALMLEPLPSGARCSKSCAAMSCTMATRARLGSLTLPAA
jgi:hypothetical protein